MPKQDWSVIFGEQPNAAKWNILGENDDYFDEAVTEGWAELGETFTYASASTITVASDATTRFQKGDKIRFKQGAGYKYYVVVAVAATVLTVLVNTDYTVANAAISDVWVSRAARPFGFPSGFAITGFATTGWGTPTYNTGRLELQAGTGHFEADVSGTSNSTSTVFTMPVNSRNAVRRLIRSTDNGGTPVAASMDMTASSATLTLYSTLSSATWTNSGTKRVEFAIDFEW